MSDCACLYGGGDDYGPEFWSDTQPVARKPHTCCECKETIAPGTRYERYAGKWEGEVRTYTTCLPCREIRAALYCDTFVLMQLWEDVRDQIFNEGGLTIACIDKVTTAEGKMKLQQAWMDYLKED